MPTRLLLIGSLALLLVGCGGGGGGGGGGGASSNGGGGGGVSTADRVSIAVSAPAAPVPAGSIIEIDVAIANPSADTATGVAATLSLGPNLTRGTVTCAAAKGASCPANAATLAVGDLPGGGTITFYVKASLAAGASGAISSTASVASADDPVVSNNSVQVVVNAYSADVRVTSASAGGEFFSGALATYSATVANAGPDTAYGLGLQDVVGPGQALSSITCTAAGGAVCPATSTGVMTIPTLPSGGSLTFDVKVSIGPHSIGPISNTLYASTDGDPVTSNNVATISATARVPTSAQSPSFVVLQSDTGDYIGGGAAYSYDRSNALIDVGFSMGVLVVNIRGDQTWSGSFAPPSSQTQLSPGTYSGLTRYPFHDMAVGGLSWYGEGRGCNMLTGSFTVDNATYTAGSLSVVDLRFEQHCEGMGPALRGQIHWIANDSTLPPGPVNPPPAGLWAPAAGATPATGNYIYLQSDAADYIGAGRTYTYTQTNAVLTVTDSGGHLSITVAGNEGWNGDFQTMTTLSTIQPGYYGNLARYPFQNPTAGGLSWYGEGRGCNTLTGWVAIDSVTYAGSAIASVDMRFEQHCEGGPAALRGKLHWVIGDPTEPAGPQVPPPAGLWTSPAGATPASGNYVYLESETGDYIGNAGTYTYTQANAILQPTTTGAHLTIGIHGNEDWSGDFQGMNTLSQLVPGYYGNLQRYPFNNPVAGGLSWSGEGRGCNTLTGWFVVDSISFAGNSLAAIDLRFEQHCEGGPAALHGRIHWAADDPTQPPGPQDPPPANLWAPAAGATPATGNYVYLASDSGDFIGQGYTYTYTGANAILNVTAGTRLLNVSVTGDQDWSGEFAGTSGQTQLVPGYYADLQRYPFNNPVVGGLSWSGEGRGCNTLTGWFVIDSVTYSSGTLASLDLRFEQHCENFTAALRGKIHWTANDSTQPPGPQLPPPSNLWSPQPGTTPASGNYVYLDSDPGDYIGQGQTYTLTPSTYSLDVSATGGHMTINVGGWSGDFQAMSSIAALQPGYYGGLQRYPFHNPTKGGLSWSGQGRGCNVLSGWFTVDSVTYSAGTLASIDLRFEQHCESGATALHGKIHWIR